MAVTIKDVAKLANVSIATVSLVINNKRNISDATRKKVFDAVKQLNYYPRRSARGLPSKRCGNIGFITTDDHFSKAEPFYTKIFVGSELEARKHKNYILLTTVPRKFKIQRDIPLFLLEKNVDGVLMAGWIPDELIEYIYGKNIPYVFIDYYPGNKTDSAVLLDNEKGGETATEYLIKLGHRDIGFVGGDINHPSIEERFQGYKNALIAHGIEIDDRLIFIENYTAQEDGYRASEKILKSEKKPTAIFASNDTMALGCIKGLQEHGLRVPDNISFVGFDDIVASMLIDPPLTTLQVDKEEFGSLAVNKIMRMINNNKKSIREKVERVAVKLIIRKSCKRSKNQRENHFETIHN